MKELREKIIKCLYEERKINVELEQKFYEVERDIFRDVMKDLDFESELHNLIRLYLSLIDLNSKMEYVNFVIDN